MALHDYCLVWRDLAARVISFRGRATGCIFGLEVSWNRRRLSGNDDRYFPSGNAPIEQSRRQPAELFVRRTQVCLRTTPWFPSARPVQGAIADLDAE